MLGSDLTVAGGKGGGIAAPADAGRRGGAYSRPGGVGDGIGKAFVTCVTARAGNNPPLVGLNTFLSSRTGMTGGIHGEAGNSCFGTSATVAISGILAGDADRAQDCDNAAAGGSRHV